MSEVRREIPHEWQEMPGYLDELFCCRCGVVKAMSGTNGCTASERREYARLLALRSLA